MVSAEAKRGRKRTYDAAKTRSVILDAASAVFAEHGFDGAPVDTIAAKAGYNKSLIFQYFGDKLGLYTQVLKWADQEMGQLMARVFAPLLDDKMLTSDVDRFRNFLENLCGAIFDYMVAHPHIMRLFNWEQAESWLTFTRLASQFEPEHLARFGEVFLDARGTGLLRSNLDTIAAVMLIQQVCWSSLAALPLYQSLYAGQNMPPAALLAQLREQKVTFLVAGMLNDPEKKE